MEIEVEALDTYIKYNITDKELKRVPKTGERFTVSKERLNVLMGNNADGRIYVKIVEPVKEVKKTVLPKKETKRKSK